MKGLILQDKWSDLFPTIVTKAKTIEVLETGTLGNRSGSLQLVIIALESNFILSFFLCLFFLQFVIEG